MIPTTVMAQLKELFRNTTRLFPHRPPGTIRKYLAITALQICVYYAHLEGSVAICSPTPSLLQLQVPRWWRQCGRRVTEGEAGAGREKRIELIITNSE